MPNRSGVETHDIGASPDRKIPGITWSATVTLTGPDGGLGVEHINVGFMQECYVSSMAAYYQGTHVLGSSLNGNSYFDKLYVSPGPYCSVFGNAVIFNATPDAEGDYTATIQSSDRPDDGPPTVFPGKTSSFVTSWSWSGTS
jgi:hypothetical protein